MWSKGRFNGVKMTKTLEKKPFTAEELWQFSGTTQYWRESPLHPFLCTDGVHFLAERGGAFWLLDAIASWQPNKQVRDDGALQAFQVWTLKVSRDSSAELLCERDWGDVVIRQKIEFTDFPLSEIKLYLCDMQRHRSSSLLGRQVSNFGVLMIPSEY